MLGPHGRPIESQESRAFEDAIDDHLGEIVVVQDVAPSLRMLVGREDHRSSSDVAIVDDVVEDVRNERAGCTGPGGASNRALRKAGDARRWCTLLREGQYTLSEATFVLLDPKVKDALVQEGLYTSFMAGLGRQLGSFPLAIAFWIAAMHAWKSQTTVNVVIVGVVFIAWMGVRRWVARPAPT